MSAALQSYLSAVQDSGAAVLQFSRNGCQLTSYITLFKYIYKYGSAQELRSTP